MKIKTAKIYLLSGERDAGKTTFCRSLVENFRYESFTIRGVVCPAGFTDGEKSSINLVNLADGSSRLMAIPHNEEPGKINTIRWSFDPLVLAEGNRILAAAIPCDLLIIDELGPLEFERNLGWQNGLLALDSGEFNAAIAVVRPSLINLALLRWPAAGVITLTPANREEKRASLIKSLDASLK